MSTLLIRGGELVDELFVRQVDVLIQDQRVAPGYGRSARA